MEFLNDSEIIPHLHYHFRLEIMIYSSNNKTSCQLCSAAPFCLTSGHLTGNIKAIKIGDYLFRQQDQFSNFYVVKEGAFKGFHLTKDGREQINNFFLPGEFIGLNAINAERYDFFSSAMVDQSVVCEISFEKLLLLTCKNPKMQLELIKLITQQLNFADAIPRNAHAIEKMSAFLVNIALRYHHHNPTNTEHLRLPMSRQDIGNYLGLAMETVSRIFTKFKKNGIFFVDGKEIIITDVKKLISLAACEYQLI